MNVSLAVLLALFHQIHQLLLCNHGSEYATPFNPVETLKKEGHYINYLTLALDNLFGFLPNSSKKQDSMKVLKINSSFLGEQMKYVSKRQKMYLLAFDPLIILLGRKQAETSYIVTNLKSGNKQKFNNWKMVS